MASPYETFDGTPPATVGRPETIEQIILEIEKTLEEADAQTNVDELREEKEIAVRALAHLGVENTVTLAA